MGQLLVRHLEDGVIAELKRAAKEHRVSLEQHVRDVLSESVRPNTDDVWRQIDEVRAGIGPLSGSSADLIRDHRDNDEPYR